ncbi:phosphopyruvate hydratase [Candidatus Peribacteria bacterium RIFCSPLOWO2_12_FULL_55_15]|nr:MAG: phosphopyruvate hydratase [Candidatus Peribacteria bacterium RIFCSPHIGHO2_01_FULL_54_22]OGJ63367.1 MAG: phosphopyruvate hydratase [Candidatus Peribacteria bacterium RIFCSPHIGHO2_02_FULL_55_24]OGJ68220.1 MAG: phosphopyruvate hydratase [Candidatus Peribacteria bacterium RIFCSPLOWO2_01_FULL_54_110]OGJ69729.1 MAG: phosphopyruvate hydratase [Candidatus Peribacteria bacterium RIFCSPLOWO2_02_FULL_55_36]OGJ70347.1 MAG: phosphopyruvate hydratase [Candidatus Peribacteria bacterium RIFCSPLOWO2_12_
MSLIQCLRARQILDSRGNPTVEVDCVLDDGSIGRAAVPSGASTGTHEVLELRDGDKALYGGKSVLKSVWHVNGVMMKELTGKSVSDQRIVDRQLLDMDGTPNKAKLGANAILGVSMAVCRARAVCEKRSLWRSLVDQFGAFCPRQIPVPLMNVLNGGKHADSGLSFQEFMIVPTGFDHFSDALRAGVETYHALHRILRQGGYVTAVGDEGGFAPRVPDAPHAFDLLLQAIAEAGYRDRIRLAIDPAASEFYKDGRYTVDGMIVDAHRLSDYYMDITKRFPIVSIEDSHSEDDWEGFTELNERTGSAVQIVGDDLYVTNVERIQKGIDCKATDAVLIKLNQIGTVSETVDAVERAQKSGLRAIVSHRSGETEDTFIAHFSVALQTGQIKTGAPCRGERTCKYNELLRIEEELGKEAVYMSPFG